MDRYRRLIYTIPYRMGLDPADADDVFQITFSRLAERIGDLKEPGRVRAWLVTTARRSALNLVARSRSGDAEILARLPDPGALPSEEIERLEDQELIRAALARLGKRCRWLLTQLYYGGERPGAGAGGISYEAVAREMGVPVGSVGPTRMRCLKKLLAEYRKLSEDR